MKILIATTNKGKLKEFKRLFESLNVEVLSLEDMEKQFEVEEDRETFIENAIKKAKEYGEFYKLPVIAEDAGLEIESLNGLPGVYSARFFSLSEYGGEEPILENKDKANISKVLRLMKSKKNRKAHFVSNILFYNPENSIEDKVDKGIGLWSEGYCYGEITEKPYGEQGFGYDPIFKPDGYKKTMAQLSTEEKNKISHRGKAVRKLMKYLKKILEG